jgi:hypothetical protein
VRLKFRVKNVKHRNFFSFVFFSPLKQNPVSFTAWKESSDRWKFFPLSHPFLFFSFLFLFLSTGDELYLVCWMHDFFFINITFIIQKWEKFTNNKISINGDETYVVYWMHDKI